VWHMEKMHSRVMREDGPSVVKEAVSGGALTVVMVESRQPTD
jgi:hypothetical protein